MVSLNAFYKLAESNHHQSITDALWKLLDANATNITKVIAVLAKRPDVTRNPASHKRLLQAIDNVLKKNVRWPVLQVMETCVQIEHPGSMDRFVAHLNSHHPQVGAATAKVLARHYPRELRTFLIQDDKLKQDKLAMQIVEGMQSQQPNLDRRELLMSILTESTSTIVLRRAAALAVRWKMNEAADVLLEYLNGKRRSPPGFAPITELVDLRDRRVISLAIDRATSAAEIRSLSLFGREVTEPMIKLLRRKPRIAADVLALIGDKRAVTPLISLLKDPSKSEYHFDAVIALGHLGDARALDVLVDRLQNPGNVNTSFTTTAICQLPRTAVVPRMEKLLMDGVQTTAVKTILTCISSRKANLVLQAHR